MQHLNCLLSKVDKSLSVEVSSAIEMVRCEKVNSLLDLGDNFDKLIGLVHDGSTL